MDTDIIWDVINHLDDDSIAFSSDNPWPRKFAIDSHNALSVAQSGNILQPYLKKLGREKKYTKMNILKRWRLNKKKKKIQKHTLNL